MIKQEQYETKIKIRIFEEHILDLFGRNMLSGTTHTYIGKEATVVAMMSYVKEEDAVFSNHRCHGHYLVYSGGISDLLKRRGTTSQIRNRIYNILQDM